MDDRANRPSADRIRIGDQTATTWLWLAAAMLLCVILGTLNISKASLWTDEIFSRYYYDVFGLHFLLGDGLTIEPTPPTYPIVLKLWMTMFGHGEAALRSLSVVAYVACLPAVYLLGIELASRRAANVAAFLVATSPMGIYFAQEARVYAFTLLPSCLLLWATAVLLRNPRSRPAAVAYVLAGTVCLYLHATMIFLLASCAMTGCAWILARPAPAKWTDLSRWVAYNAAVACLSLPYTMHVLTASHGSGLDWMPPLGLAGIASALTTLTTGVLTARPLPGVVIAVLVLGALGASLAWRRPQPRTVAVTLVIPALFFIMVCAVSLVRPVLLPRIICWAIVPVAILTARQMLSGGWPGRLMVATTLLAVVVGLTSQETAPYGGKEPWRQVFAELIPNYQGSDLVVLSPRFDPLILDYYAPRLRNVRVWNDGRLPATIMTEASEHLGIPAITRADIQRQIVSGRAVWLLTNAVDVPYADGLKGAITAQYDAKWPCGRNSCIEVTGWTSRHLPSAPRPSS